MYRPWVLVPDGRGDDETGSLTSSPVVAVRTGRTDPDFRSEHHSNQ